MLMQELDVSEKFIGKLYEDEVFNGDERDLILSFQKARQRRREFLNILEKTDYKGESPFPPFLAALSFSHQFELKNKLENEDFLAKIGEEQNSKREEIKIELQVRKNYVYIVDNIDLQGSSLLDLFFQEGIINEDDRATINYHPGNEQARKFISIVESKKHGGKSAYPFFLEALDKSEQHYIRQKIEEVEITEKDFQDYASELLPFFLTQTKIPEVTS